jgi:hypothetical protein
MSRAVSFLIGLLCIGLCSGCDRFDEHQRTQIASKGEWTLIAIGDLESPGRGLARNRVGFEVEHLGVTYAKGDLYSAGPNDHGFRARFEQIEWLADNVVRLSYVPRKLLKTRTLTVQNAGSDRVRWLKIVTSELFLVFDLPARQTKELTMRWWGDPTFEVVGELFDGQLVRTSQSIPDHAHTLDLTINPDGTATVTTR